jgi:hypothetical protein
MVEALYVVVVMAVNGGQFSVGKRCANGSACPRYNQMAHAHTCRRAKWGETYDAGQ